VPLEHRLGSPDLRRCQNIPHARCGRIQVPGDPTGSDLGTVTIGFELYPRRDRSRPLAGTIVAVEGGPGYSTTGSRDYYRDLFEPLLDRRRLLLVDLRGTGRSDQILCQPLQSYRGNYLKAVGRCGRQLGDASDLYGSAFAARDLVAVLDHLGIERIDLYGDSYGTFFSQTFAVRYPERLRSLILDSAYYVAGTDPFYVDTNRALRDAFRFACMRSPACAELGGDPMRRIARLARMLRRDPVAGRAPDADGEVARVEVDVGGLIYLVTAAASSPAIYRELDAAARAALRANPYVLPLLRLARETFYDVRVSGSMRWALERLAAHGHRARQRHPRRRAGAVLLSGLVIQINPLAALAGHHEQVLVAVLGRAVGRASIRALGEVEEIPLERGRPFGLVGERGLNGDHRAEGLFHQLVVAMRARRSLDILAAVQLERIDPMAEELAYVILAPPQERGERARRGRGRVGREGPEELRGQALGREVDHPDRAAGTAHAQHLIRDRLVIRREDRAKRGRDHVELAVAEGKRLCVRFDPVELHPYGAGLPAPCLEVLGREVGGHDLGTHFGRTDGDVARAGRHVEHPLPGRDSARLDEHRPQLPNGLLGEPVVVAERPHGPGLGALLLRGPSLHRVPP
jgi:pimeloyl-ACP methyl ester carboxylesterase